MIRRAINLSCLAGYVAMSALCAVASLHPSDEPHAREALIACSTLFVVGALAQAVYAYKHWHW